MKQCKSLVLFSVFTVSLFLVASMVPLVSWNDAEGEEGREGIAPFKDSLESEVTISSQGFTTPVTPRADFDETWTPIYNVQDLSDIQNDLSGKYYLANNIDFSTDTSGYDNGGIMIPLKVEVKSGNILDVTIGTTGNTLANTHISFGNSWIYYTTAGTVMSISSNLTNATQTLVVFGMLNSQSFAFSLEINTSSMGAKFNGNFDSNGNFTSIKGKFTGVFDGNGYVISGMHTSNYVYDLLESYTGLFSYAGDGAEISNLGVVNGSVIASSRYSSVLSPSYAGGIVGFASSVTITNCYNAGSVTASSYASSSSPLYSASSLSFAGGIVGYVFSDLSLPVAINSCQNTGSVTASSYSSSPLNSSSYVGGIAGNAQSNTSSVAINSCQNTGSVTALSYSPSSDALSYAGGIVGRASLYSPSLSLSFTITNCNNTGSVTASSSSFPISHASSSSYVGGIVGHTSPSPSSFTITNCNNTGSVTASSSSFPTSYPSSLSYAGGIIGYVSSTSLQSPLSVTITDCYNTGSVTATSNLDAYAGGIAGLASSSATISDCYNTGSVTAFSSYSDAYAGGIAGLASSSATISDCYNTGSITASSSSLYVGGIAGLALSSATISDCYNTGSIIAPSSSSSPSLFAGGIVGHALSVTITNCYNTGSIIVSSHSNLYVGGIVGCASLVTITNCYNTGSIIASSSSSPSLFAGGIIGSVLNTSSATITNCYNTGSVSISSSSYSSYAGGIVGSVSYSSSATITNCYNTGSVSVSSSSISGAGGIVGDTTASSSSSPLSVTIINCYNTGSVSAASYSDAYAGGIVGFAPTMMPSSVTIINSYNASLVSVSSSSSPSLLGAGGIVGFAPTMMPSSVTIINCYYLTGQQKINGIFCPDGLVGLGSVNVDSGIANPSRKISSPDQRSSAKTSDEMKPNSLSEAQDNNSIYFTGTTTPSGGSPIAGWNFTNVWGVDTNVNSGYPILRSFLFTVSVVNNPRDQVVAEGGSVSFSGSGAVLPDLMMPIYRWQVSMNNGLTWSDIPEANAQSYTIHVADWLYDRNLYRLVIIAPGYGVTVESNYAILTVTTTPNPIIRSANNTSVVNGTEGMFTVIATGDAPITYSLSGTVPAGVSINSSSGIMIISPSTAVGIYTFTVTVSNGVSPNAMQFFTLEVEAVFTITYYANGGYGPTITINNIVSGTAYNLADASKFTAPSNKQFKNWNTASNGSGTSYSAGQQITITSNLTLYATWEDIPVPEGNDGFDLDQTTIIVILVATISIIGVAGYFLFKQRS